jgi:phosphatidylglycerol:prolipoprotein diacylglycerol transferase
MRKMHLPKGIMMALYLIGYGAVRFFIEFFRQPDTQLGFVWRSLSMGQILCGFMIIGGIFIAFYLNNLKNRYNTLNR